MEYWRTQVSDSSNLVWFPNSRKPFPKEVKPKVWASGKLSLLYAGHVKREKGVSLLLEAYRRIVESKGDMISLTIVGRCNDPSLLQELDSYDIKFLGELSHQETTQQMLDHHVFVFPTYWNGEGHPGVLLEAMQAGMPILCADWRFLGELVQQNFNGMLFEAKRVEGIVSALEDLLENPPKLEEMSGNSLHFIKDYDAGYWMKEFYPSIISKLKK